MRETYEMIKEMLHGLLGWVELVMAEWAKWAYQND
jgi:hypothetical protein